MIASIQKLPRIIFIPVRLFRCNVASLQHFVAECPFTFHSDLLLPLAGVRFTASNPLQYKLDFFGHCFILSLSLSFFRFNNVLDSLNFPLFFSCFFISFSWVVNASGNSFFFFQLHVFVESAVESIFFSFINCPLFF